VFWAWLGERPTRAWLAWVRRQVLARRPPVLGSSAADHHHPTANSPGRVSSAPDVLGRSY
jgi:hypothetical protein